MSVPVGSLAAVALALYRKYRPAKFAEVVGQEHVTEPLRTALSFGRISHAYLFSGPRGCGKTSSARILARSLNCELGPTPDPCGACPSCVALAPEGPGSIDVVELDAASHGGVDDARELRDRAFYAPAQSRYRVFIVDEAHMVTTQGFNALLKIVEEPPDHLVFVFATTEPDKVLPTIRSRTHHYPFRLIPPGTLRTLLERICAEEGAVVAPAVLPLVIRAGGGSARDSLSVLDQLLAGAGPAGVIYERAVALLGVTDVALIDDVVDALAAGDGAAVYETVDRLVEAGHDPRRFAADLLQRLRDVTLLQAVPEAANQGIVEAADDELARMAEQAGKLGAATLSRYSEIVHNGLTEMRGATAPRLLLELLCARMLLPAASTADSALLERLERMERRIAIAPPAQALAPVVDGSSSGPRAFVRPSEGGAVANGECSTGTSVDDGFCARTPSEAPAAAARDAVALPVGRPDGPGARPDRLDAAAQPRGAAPARSDVSGGTSTPAEVPAGLDAAPAPTRLSAPSALAGVGPAPTPVGLGAGPTPTGLDAAAVRRVWPDVLAAAKQRSRSTEALLVNATARAVEGDDLLLTIGSAPLAKRLSEQRNTDVIADSLHAVLGVRWRVRCEHGDGPGPPAPARDRPQHTPPAAPARRPPPLRRGPAPAAVPDDGVPLPPEPPADEPLPDDEESMMAEMAAGPRVEPVSRRDPEEAAIELLSAQLGARALDQR